MIGIGRAGLRLGLPNHPETAPAENKGGEENGQASTKLDKKRRFDEFGHIAARCRAYRNRYTVDR